MHRSLKHSSNNFPRSIAISKWFHYTFQWFNRFTFGDREKKYITKLLSMDLLARVKKTVTKKTRSKHLKLKKIEFADNSQYTCTIISFSGSLKNNPVQLDQNDDFSWCGVLHSLALYLAVCWCVCRTVNHEKWWWARE